MGFYFRRGINFGPIRFNFSKSGIGVSAGIKGARVSTGPRGTYVHAGTHGFYYRQKIGSHDYQPPRQQGRSPQNPNEYNGTMPLYGAAHRIETADVDRLVDTSSAKLLDQINTASTETRIAPFAAFATLSATVFVFLISLYLLTLKEAPELTKGIVPIICSGLVALVGTYFSWRIHKGDELKRTTPLFYELEQDALTKFKNIQKGVEILSNSSRIWRIETEQQTRDRKRNAGASSLITRFPVYAKQEQPPYIATNVAVWCIKLNDQTFYFLPDYIFIRQNGMYGAVTYESFGVNFLPTTFIESQGVPPDSRVVNTTWTFVNKNGGPDRRFSNNRQLPIVQYGFLQFQTRTGMNIHLNVSNLELARTFAYIFSERISSGSQARREGRKAENTKPWTNRNAGLDDNVRSAYETLGLTIHASTDEVVAAYRQMAKMYHPDRLAHLAPEFVEIAEERMKEINIAYEILKKYATA